MSAVTNTTILERFALNVKSVLESEVGTSITDPQSSSRDSTNPFIRVRWGRIARLYPHIVVDATIGDAEILGLKGDALMVSVLVHISVVSTDIHELDSLMSQVLDVMRLKRTVFDSYNMRRPKGYLQDVSGILTNTREQTHMRTATFEFIYFMT